MHRHDDFEDLSHLPTVDDVVSDEDKQMLWKKKSKSPLAEPVPEFAASLPVADEKARRSAEAIDAERRAVERSGPERGPSHGDAAGTLAEDPVPPRAPPSRVPDWAAEALAVPKRPAVRREPPIVSSKHPAEAATSPKSGPETPVAKGAGGSQVPGWVREAFGDGPGERAAGRAKSAATPSRAESKGEPRKNEPTAKQASKEPSPSEQGRDQQLAMSSSRDSKEKPGSQDGGQSPRDEVMREDKPPADDHSHPPPVPHLPHDDPRPLTRKEKLQLQYEKWGGRSLLWSVGLHLVFLIIAAIIVVQQTIEDEVDFLPGGSQAAQEASAEMEHQVRKKKLKKSLAQNMQLKRVMSLSQNAALSLPEAPPDMFDIPDQGMLDARDIGRGMGSGGMGGGLGKGLGIGGKITFLGNTATGRHIIFVVDVSASMSALSSTSNGGRRISRFELLKEELNKSLSRLPAGTGYQVIYFSDFAWPHNELDTHNLKAFDKYQWEITPKNINVHIPSFRYLKADMLSILRSRDVINASDNPGGTNWGSGLLMALKGVPKPDFIFFMTDGNRADAEGWLDVVTNFNIRSNKKTIIHTTAMMEPDAARELDDLAKRNGGNFTIVNADGSITTSKDYFAK